MIVFHDISGKRVSRGRRDQVVITAMAEGDGTYLEVEDAFEQFLINAGYQETGNLIAPWGQEFSSSVKLVGKNMWRVQIECNNDEAGADRHGTAHAWWRCSATFEPPRMRRVAPPRPNQTHLEIGQYTFRGDTHGATTNVKYAISVSDSAGNTHFAAYPSAAKKLVGWTGGEPEDHRIEGVDVPSPALTQIYTVIADADDLTDAYIKSMAASNGKTNSAAFKTFDAGEAMYVGMTHSFLLDADDNEAVELNLTVRFMRNVAALGVEGWNDTRTGTTTHTVAKKGWEYATMPGTQDQIGVDEYDEGGIMLTLPDGISAQQVVESINFNDLLPGALTWAGLELVIV